MISAQRQRELTMQIARFTDGAQGFPEEINDEEMAFVDRIVAVQELLLADSELAVRNSVAVHHPAAVASMKITLQGGIVDDVSSNLPVNHEGTESLNASVDQVTLPAETCNHLLETVENQRNEEI